MREPAGVKMQAAFASPDKERLKQAIAQRRATRVDPLAARDYWKDDVLVKTAAEHGTVFHINLSPAIKLQTSQRPQAFREIKIFLGKCVKFKAKFAIAADSADPLDAKSPRELQAIATEILGLDQHVAKAAVTPLE
ncbi:MAG: RNase P subunit p30 family protein [Candidatus Micrarchaeota archaeon]